MIQISAFLTTIAPIALSPGVGFTLALSNTTRDGLKGVLPIIGGTALGIYSHAILVGLGVTQVLSSSKILMEAIHFSGLAFLLWLAIKLLLNGSRTLMGRFRPVDKSYRFRDAFYLNLLNVKAIVLYLTVVSHFAGNNFGNYLILSSLHILVMSSWLLLSSFLMIQAKRKFKVNLVSGLVSCIGSVTLFSVVGSDLFSR
ncbi:LysE family transporter [Vibrio profundum]|uniref:LysE family translocator n=1 Tax=Vibrio profundum TaxID=2910247 RepID=UPI003D12DD34